VAAVSDNNGAFLGIDIGSSSAKAVATDSAGHVISSVGEGQLKVERPTAGGWEIDPTQLFDACCDAVRQLPPPVRSATRAVGVTGQMCGLVPLAKDRRPADRCLPIFDDRSLAESRELEDRYGDHLRRHAGNGALPVYTLPKLLWLRRNRPESFERTDLVVLPKDYVRGRLTGEWVTEPSDASGTLAFDQHTGDWDHALLAGLDLPSAQWPKIVGSASLAGAISVSASEATGIPAGTPVAAGAADMAAVPVGVGATTTGDIVASVGTAAHVISPVDTLSAAWPVQQYTSAFGARWFRFGAVYSGGVCAQWLVDLLRDPGGFEIFAEPVNRPVNEQVLFTPYLAGAGAPHELPEAAGAFLGLRLGHSRNDLARAILYGIAFEMAEIHRVHDPEGVRRIHVTGGGTRLGPLVQILADALDREVLLSASPDAAGVGAARIGAVAVGAVALEERREGGTVISPDPQGVSRLAMLRPLYDRAARAVRSLAADG
jgi:xylulokinase